MERISVTQAARQFSDLIKRVVHQGASFELQRGKKVVARLVPAKPPSVRAGDLHRLFAELPRLGEDADAFAKDLEAIRRSPPPENNPWT